MNIEIKANVTLRGAYGVKYVTVLLTEDDLRKTACAKALEDQDPSYYERADFDGVESVNTKND